MLESVHRMSAAELSLQSPAARTGHCVESSFIRFHSLASRGALSGTENTPASEASTIVMKDVHVMISCTSRMLCTKPGKSSDTLESCLTLNLSAV